MPVTDPRPLRESNGSGRQKKQWNAMNTERNGRGDRIEMASRGLLGLALLSGVAWALIDGGLRLGF